MNKLFGEPKDYWKRPIDDPSKKDQQREERDSSSENEKNGSEESSSDGHISYMKGKRLGF